MQEGHAEGSMASSALGQDQKATSFLISIPDEILLLICSFLHPRQLMILSGVSTRFRNVTLTAALWESFFDAELSHWLCTEIRVGYTALRSLSETINRLPDFK